MAYSLRARPQSSYGSGSGLQWESSDMDLALPQQSASSAFPTTIEFAKDVEDPSSGASDFVKRLFRMLEEKMFPSIVAWTVAGDAFIVKDMNEFTKSVLPRMFKHSNFASFVRQLNKYSFHKIKNPAAEDRAGDQAWVFKHPDFRTHYPAGLENVKRKAPPPRRPSPPPGGGDPELSATVEGLTRTCDELRALVRTLDAGYQSVLRELVGLQRTVAQQDALVQALMARDAQQQPPQLPTLPTLQQLSQQPTLSQITPPSLPSPPLQHSGSGSASPVPSSLLSGADFSGTDLCTSPEDSLFPAGAFGFAAPGAGAGFFSFPPASIGGEVKEGSQSPSPPPSHGTLVKNGSRWAVPPRVLLVDDDAVSRTVSGRFLAVSGCAFDVAVDGLAAVDKMGLSKYDLVLMDIMMPRLDGLSATSLIRQFDAATPIISMTGNATPGDVMNYYSHGMNDILSKPFTKEGLVHVLEKHLVHLRAIQASDAAWASTAGLLLKRPLEDPVLDGDEKRPRIEVLD